MSDEAAGDARWIEVGPERLAGWLESFAQRHGEVTGEADRAVVTFRAADGAVAECHVPFPPLPAGPRPATGGGDGAGTGPDDGGAGAGGAGGASGKGSAEAGTGAGGEGGEGSAEAGTGAGGAAAAGLGTAAGLAARIAAHARAERTVGVLLVRLGGYAAGVFTGPDAHLAASKVGSRLVHGRSAAGGTSQQRFARRREKQASEALGAAADVAAAVLGPYSGRLDAVVLGGDRRAIAGLRDDPRLRPLFKLAVERFLTVPDPRLAVLRGTPRLFRAIRIRLTEPRPPGPDAGGG